MVNWNTIIYDGKRLNKNTIFIKSLKYLLILSIWSVLLEWIVAFNVFYFNSLALGILLKVVWVSKLILCLPCLLYLRSFVSFGYIWVLLVIVSINTLIGLIHADKLSTFLASIFFYSITIFGIYSGNILSKLFSEYSNKLIKYFPVNPIIILLSILMAIYYILVYVGRIEYFGMGLQLYIIVAAILAHKNSYSNLVLIFLCVIFSGKRALLITEIVQIYPIFRFKLDKLKDKFTLSIIIFLAISLLIYVGLLERFSTIMDIGLSDFADFEVNKSKFYLATSGRSEEVIGFFRSISISDYGFWFGYPAGYSFDRYDLSIDDNISHHYFHFSPLNYFKDFGILLFVFLIVQQVRAFLYAFKELKNRKDFLLYLYVGYFMAMFFGSIVTIDALFWVAFGYSYAEMKKKCHKYSP